MHMTVPERTQALSLHRGPGLGSERTDDDIEGRGVIKLAGVTAGYGGEPVLSDVSLEINRVDFVCFEGPSGVGKTTGCVFQSYELLPQLTALENVLLPLQLAQYGLANPEARAADALEMVGLADKAESVPGELSGGQQQRVAIARAIAHEPSILLADEPTGNLDPISTAEVMHAFEAYHEQGGTVVMATHDELLRDRYARRVLRIQARAA